jgi:hypothetical protein
MGSFKRLIRFKDYEGKIHFGEAPEVASFKALIGDEVQTYDDPFSLSSTIDTATTSIQKAKVAELLSPIASAAHIYGIGLNYKGHAAEAGVSCYPLLQFFWQYWAPF